MNQKLTIQIVGWNSATTLPQVIAGLKTIPTSEVIIRYLDNGSTDESVQLMRERLPQADIVELKENLGYAAAHNEGFRRCSTPFVLTHDPDVTLDWAGIQELMKIFDDPTVGATQGKLLRAGSELLDSAGIVLTLALNGKERGANMKDEGEYEELVNVTAVTGACGLYRMAALHSVAFLESEIFDEDFFSYKEDVDLGWRLTRHGWHVVYQPVLMGWHARTMGRRGVLGWGLNPRNIYQRLRSPRTRYSFRNWLWMIVKNATPLEIVTHQLFIDIRLLTFFFLSLLYPPFFMVWVEVAQGIRRMIKKRIRKRIH